MRRCVISATGRMMMNKNGSSLYSTDINFDRNQNQLLRYLQNVSHWILVEDSLCEEETLMWICTK